MGLGIHKTFKKFNEMPNCEQRSRFQLIVFYSLLFLIKFISQINFNAPIKFDWEKLKTHRELNRILKIK